MDKKAEEYRRKGAAAEAAAELAHDDAAKQIYIEKARRLRKMADQAEQSCPPNVFPHEPPGATTMADDRTVKGEQDRSRINLSENYEVRYWTQKFGVTAAELRDAIKKVGNSAEAVEKELAG